MKESKADINRYTMFLDWKYQYCENNYTAQSYLHAQSSLGQTQALQGCLRSKLLWMIHMQM